MRTPAIVIGFISVSLVQCATVSASDVSVSSIEGNPSRYVGEVVQVYGEVATKFQIPFFDVSLYLLSDDQETMGVVGRGEAPETGNLRRVRVKVAGITSEGSADVADSAVFAIADFLVDHEIVDRSAASASAARIVDFISSVAGFAEGSYLLVEQ